MWLQLAQDTGGAGLVDLDRGGALVVAPGEGDAVAGDAGVTCSPWTDHGEQVRRTLPLFSCCMGVCPMSPWMFAPGPKWTLGKWGRGVTCYLPALSRRRAYSREARRATRWNSGQYLPRPASARIW